jgi:hypothetical protein
VLLKAPLLLQIRPWAGIDFGLRWI